MVLCSYCFVVYVEAAVSEFVVTGPLLGGEWDGC